MNPDLVIVIWFVVASIPVWLALIGNKYLVDKPYTLSQEGKPHE